MKKLLPLLLLLSLTIRAQQFTMTPLPNQQKLPQSEVYRIFEDSEGYMWYAMRDAGLCRDNGYQVDVFRSDRNHTDLLRSNSVTCIAENVKRDEIWFGTRQGAYVLSKRDYSVRTLQGVKNHVHSIVQSADGAFWVAANKQVKVFSEQGEPQDSFALSWKGMPMSVESMTLDSRGTLWLMQWDGGVQVIDTRTRQLQTMNWEEPAGATSLAEDSVAHRYYVGTWGAGVFGYDGQQARPLTPELTSQIQRKVRSVHYDKWRNMLWVVTMAGLYAYDIEADGSLKPHPLAQLGATSQQAIYPLFFDHDGRLWVPGATPLTFILQPTPKERIKRTSLDPLTRQAGVQLPIGAMQSDGDYCWLWSDRTQLVLYHQPSGRLTTVNGTPDEGTTRFGNIMTRRATGGIWCASGRAVYAFLPDERQVKSAQQPVLTLTKSVTALREGPDGKLYIGTSEGVLCYEPQSRQLTVLAKDTRTVRDIVVTSDGTVYFISTSQGICRLRKGQPYDVLAPYQRFTSLALSPDGTLWTGNAFGDVWRVDSTLSHVALASSAESNGVKQLLADSLNHLWVMGDTYLTEFFPESGRRRLFRSTDKDIRLDNFGGISLTNDGQILVAGGGGLLLMSPEQPDEQGTADAPIVAAYATDGHKQLLSAMQERIRIPSDAVMLKLELTNHNYLNAGEQQFAYRLKGLSDQWIELPAGSNTVDLINLSKGTYVLELKVCDSYAHWSEPVKALTIERLPAWWETWWAYLCYLLLFIGLIAWGIRNYLRRSKEKTQRQMDERLAEMKLRFFTNVSHELRTPLSLIITPLESLMKNADEPLQKRLTNIYRHANELLDLVNRLLDFRKLDMGEMKLKPSSGDLLEFLRNCAMTFEPMATSKGLQFNVDIPTGTLYTEFDSRAMQHVVYNLLSNALKYTEAGSVSIKVVQQDKLTLTVSDTGKGIDAAELPRIFDRYYQAQNANDTSVVGSGIGLNMVKELVEQMGGSIAVDSRVGEGTTFTVVLPFAQTAEEDPLPTSPVIPKLPSVLIADDNDDFRDFLVQELKDDYNILQARNGKEALRLAQTHYVDVILSDVMMPQMDGNELCRQLKQDESTSHILIILLTAKTAEESRLEGYESGADYYLTKPFSLDLLKNRLKSMAEKQQERILMLAKAEQQEEKESEDELRISPIDRKFMTKMKSIMEQHVADTDFGVEVFCAEMAMSRMNFYRKMHALTGQTPAQYINDYRLALADRLLHEGELNITEIADRTGFSTASYFSKCYKAKFGITPKDVRTK